MCEGSHDDCLKKNFKKSRDILSYQMITPFILNMTKHPLVRFSKVQVCVGLQVDASSRA
jgi:hypothetical protein